MPEDRTARVYYLNGFVRIEADSDEEALRKFEEAGFGPSVQDPNVDGVTLAFEGPWDEIAEGDTCICPPDLIARGGFKGGCRVHG